MSNFFKTIRYQRLANWSVSHLLANQFGYNDAFELVSIGDFLIRNKTAITVDDETMYKRVKIRLYNKGIKVRDTVIGKKIGTKKQFLISKGQFLLSKIDARNGAFGIATEDVDKAIITADFFAYDIDESKIIPQFLVLLTTTEQFQKFAQSASSGTTGRQRMDEKKFLDVKIPLPSISKQKKILEIYYKKINESIQQENEILKKENEINRYFIDELGLIDFNNSESKKLSFVKFNDLKSWSVKDLTTNSNTKSSRYNMLPFSQIVVGKPQYGSNSKAINKISEFRYIRITDINEDGSLNNKIVSCAKVDPKYILNHGDFLFARSGSVGLSFMFDSSFGKCVYAGYLIRFIIDKNIANPKFILYYTKTNTYKNWINKTKRATGVPNINAQEYLSSPIVLPPLSIQNKIEKHVTKLKNEIKVLSHKIIENKEIAKLEFENEIFNKS